MTHKPKDLEVPPSNAKPLDLKLFRFATKPNPDGDDFLPSCIDPTQKHMWGTRHLLPAFHGTSFFNSKKAAEDLKARLPNKFKDSTLTAGSINNTHGVGHEGSSGHVTIWFNFDVFPAGFKPV
ncbi:conserved hypothetical protein [Alteromonas macleodii]